MIHLHPFPIYKKIPQTFFYPKKFNAFPFYNPSYRKYVSFTQLIYKPYLPPSKKLGNIPIRKITTQGKQTKIGYTSQLTKKTLLIASFLIGGTTSAFAYTMTSKTSPTKIMQEPSSFNSNINLCTIQSHPLSPRIVECIKNQEKILGWFNFFHLKGDRIVCSKKFIEFLNFTLKYDLLTLKDEEKEKISQKEGALSLEELNFILQREFKRKKKTERWDILHNSKYLLYKKELFSFFEELGLINPTFLKASVKNVPSKDGIALIFGSTVSNMYSRALKTFLLHKKGKIHVNKFYCLSSNRPIKDTERKDEKGHKTGFNEYTLLRQMILEVEDEKTRIYWKKFFEDPTNRTEVNAFYFILKDRILKDDFKKYHLVFINAKPKIGNEDYRTTTDETLNKILEPLKNHHEMFAYLNETMYCRLFHQTLLKTLLSEGNNTSLDQFEQNCKKLQFNFCSGKTVLEAITQEEELSKKIRKILDEIARNVYNVREKEKIFLSMS